MNMILNVIFFIIGGTVGVLLLAKKREKEIVPEKKEVREHIPTAPGSTKLEDYNRYMPK